MTKVLGRGALLLAASIILLTGFSASSTAADRQRISFYKINKDGITQALRFTNRKARKPGCHNFMRKARLHKVVQYHYETCHVFAKKNCEAESVMSFYRDKDPDYLTTDLSEGYGWLPIGQHKRGEKAKSWYCE